MRINNLEITVDLTPKELHLLRYSIRELLEITADLDIKRGFSLNMQSDCQEILSNLDDICEGLKGEDL